MPTKHYEKTSIICVFDRHVALCTQRAWDRHTAALRKLQLHSSSESVLFIKKQRKESEKGETQNSKQKRMGMSRFEPDRSVENEKHQPLHHENYKLMFKITILYEFSVFLLTAFWEFPCNVICARDGFLPRPCSVNMTISKHNYNHAFDTHLWPKTTFSENWKFVFGVPLLCATVALKFTEYWESRDH